MNANFTQEEIDACTAAFEKFDADGSGTIEPNELKDVLMSMGQNPTDEEVFEMLASVDEDASGSIDFGEFMMVIREQKEASAGGEDESDTMLAYVALGGNSDLGGHIRCARRGHSRPPLYICYAMIPSPAAASARTSCGRRAQSSPSRFGPARGGYIRCVWTYLVPKKLDH